MFVVFLFFTAVKTTVQNQNATNMIRPKEHSYHIFHFYFLNNFIHSQYYL